MPGSHRDLFQAISTGCRSGCWLSLRRKSLQRASENSFFLCVLRGERVSATRSVCVCDNRAQTNSLSAMSAIPSEIFKAYDIRGVVGKTLTPEVTEAIGRAIGSQARELGQSKVCIGRDGRLSGPAVAQALACGLQSTGADDICIR